MAVQCHSLQRLQKASEQHERRRHKKRPGPSEAKYGRYCGINEEMIYQPVNPCAGHPLRGPECSDRDERKGYGPAKPSQP